MKHIRRSLASLVLLLAFGYHSPAQPNDRPWDRQRNPPEPINLDIPEPVILTPEKAKDRELAVHGARNPKVFHDLLLQLEPERGPKEQLAALAILHPQTFRRAHPNNNEQARAEAIAAQAILNPRMLPPSDSPED